MADSPKYKQRRPSTYRVRILLAIVCSQLIMLGIIKFWPVQAVSNKPMQEDRFSENVITLEDAVITRQASTPPPPPQPTAPIPEPTDEIIEEEITEIDNVEFSNNPDPLSTSNIGEQGEDEGPVAGNPQQPPQVIRIVEPTTPDAAQQANIKAEITVSFLVDTEGKVEEATIEKIRLYEDKGTGNFKIVDSIGYGLTEVTLDAALQWKFRPAREGGEAVRAYSRQIFTFGF